MTELAELGVIGRREGWPLEWIRNVWARMSYDEKEQGGTIEIEWEEAERESRYCFGRDGGDPADSISMVVELRFSLRAHVGLGVQAVSGFLSAEPEGAFLVASVFPQGEGFEWAERFSSMLLEWFFDDRVEFLTFGLEDGLGTYENPGLFCVYPHTKEIPGDALNFAEGGVVVERRAGALVVWAQPPQTFPQVRPTESVLALMDRIREAPA